MSDHPFNKEVTNCEEEGVVFAETAIVEDE